jgi:hypothetical protein
MTKIRLLIGRQRIQTLKDADANDFPVAPAFGLKKTGLLETETTEII